MSEENVITKYEGTVAWVGGKKFGDNTLYSLRLEEYDKWFRCGRVKPKVAKGDQISFDFVETEKGGYVDVGSVQAHKMEVSEEAAKKPRVAKKKTAAKSGGKDTYWEDKAKKDEERNLQISYNAAWNSAIEFCKLAKDNDCLKPIGTKKDAKFENLFDVVDGVAQKLWRKYLEAGTGPDAAQEEVDNAADEDSGEMNPEVFE